MDPELETPPEDEMLPEDYGEVNPDENIEQQFDEEGNPIEAAPPEEEAEPELEQKGYNAPPVAGADDDIAALKAEYDEAFVDRMTAIIDKRVAAATRGFSQISAQTAQASAQMPNLFKVHGARIQGAFAQLPPEVQARPNSINVAIANAMLEEAHETGDMAGTISRFAKLAGTAPSGTKAKNQNSPPPSQRPQTGGSVATRQSTAPSRAERDVKNMMDTYGLSRSEALAEIRGGN